MKKITFFLFTFIFACGSESNNDLKCVVCDYYYGFEVNDNLYNTKNNVCIGQEQENPVEPGNIVITNEWLEYYVDIFNGYGAQLGENNNCRIL